MDSSMTIKGSVENPGVTVLTQEACDGVDAIGDYMPQTLAIPQPDIQDIKAYFERPRLIQRGTFPFGSVANLFLATITPSGTTVAPLTTWFPQWDQRLAGAYGIRFTLNFMLQVSATPFHQGILALSFQYGDIGPAGFNRSDKAIACTNLPHVRLDLSEQTMVELKVPFVYTGEFMEVSPIGGTPITFPYGTVALNPILPSVSVAGITVAGYDLYCYMTDIELFGVDVINPASITLQSGTDILTKEVKQSGVVSGTLTNLAKISRFVSRGIPSLSAVAGPAAWALDTAAGVAKYFGYSKPMSCAAATKMYNTRYGGDFQVDQPLVGATVSAMQENSLVVDSSIGASDTDEMAFSYILSQWSQVCRLQVATTNVHGTAIYAAPVSPSVMWFRGGTTTPFCNIRFPSNSAGLVSQSGNVIMPSSLMALASMFRYWRGSIKFRFTFAKTKLHAGRYMVTFNPYQSIQNDINNFGGVVLGAEVVSSLQQPYGNSMIMDLKDGNVFEFTVPYVSFSPYRTFASATGGISIVCMNPLQATATVSNVVPLLVEVCGGEDFEVNDYAGMSFPFMPANGTIYQQSGSEVITTTKPPSATTMGERLMSVKQLIQIPTFNTIEVSAGAVSRYIPPWFCNVAHTRMNASLALPNAVNGTNTFEGAERVGGILSKFYAFARGGTVFHMYSAQDSPISVYQSLNDSTAALTQNPVDLRSRCFPNSVPLVLQTNGSSIHARLPTFSLFSRMTTSHYDVQFVGNHPLNGTAFGGPIGHFYKWAIRATGLQRIYTSISAADDAVLGQYQGPVPIYIPNSASTNPISQQDNNLI